jgi:hypothetical protein
LKRGGRSWSGHPGGEGLRRHKETVRKCRELKKQERENMKKANSRWRVRRKEVLGETDYSPLIQHGPHRRRHFPQFFVAVGTSLPTSYLSTIRGYTTHIFSLVRYKPHRI